MMKMQHHLVAIERRYIQAIHGSLDASLLSRRFQPRPHNPLYGHCYVASETLYHLLGGKMSPYVPFRARDRNGVVHWWLGNGGRIIDPTASQYFLEDAQPPYQTGKHCSFLTREPSKRARILMIRVMSYLRIMKSRKKKRVTNA